MKIEKWREEFINNFVLFTGKRNVSVCDLEYWTKEDCLVQSQVST